MTIDSHHPEPGVLHVVIGSTGTGKSAHAIRLAQQLHQAGHGAEIINADAMQQYKGMDIGTAKLTHEERADIPHHHFDTHTVDQESTVAEYQQRARETIQHILKRGNTPILVGGSGLYISATIYQFEFPTTNPQIRAQLEQELLENGAEPLITRLQMLDPAAASLIGTDNHRRIVRALEVITITGKPYSASLPAAPTPWMPLRVTGLTVPRAELVARLEKRTETMWRGGLLAEVEQLLPQGLEHGPTASRAIGYSQAIRQLNGQLSESEAIQETQMLTRKFARRQVSWFKRYPDVRWITPNGQPVTLNV